MQISAYMVGEREVASHSSSAEPICRGLQRNPRLLCVQIFRRTSKQVTEAGALWDQASKIYPFVGGIAHIGSLEYRFPIGAKIAFRTTSNMSKQAQLCREAEICYLGFDELYTFTESQFTFLLGRNRSVCGVRPYVRATRPPSRLATNFYLLFGRSYLRRTASPVR